MQISVKDKKNFWEQMAAVEKVKPFPKPPLNEPKKLNVILTPASLTTRPQVPSNNIITKKPLNEEPKISHEDKNSDESVHKQIDAIIKPSQIKQSDSQNEKILQNQTQNQIQNQTQNEEKIINVKDRVNLFNHLTNPILGQTVKSCITGSFTKREDPKAENHNKDRTQTKVDLSVSTPIHQAETQEEKKMSFNQKRLMLERTLANRNSFNLPQKKVIEEPKQQSQQSNEIENFTNKQKPISHDSDTETKETKKSQENKANDESDKLFMESMKDEEPQKPKLLVSGQTNDLTLQTRMTRRPKKKNEGDDFDDL